MPRKPFRFPLQPALTEAKADRDACRIRVLQRQRTLDDAQRDLERRRQEASETAQRMRELRAEEVRSPGTRMSADDWLMRTEYLESLRSLEQEQLEQVRDQQAIVRGLQHALRALETELNEAQLQLSGIERKKAEALQRWRREQEKRAEKKRDEEAQMRWTAQGTSKDPEQP